AFWKANYNYLAAVNEGSNGIHNTRLVQKLLGDAIALYTPSGTTDIKLDSNVLPSSYTLSQNYPNPFNPSTEIKFSLPEASNVKLTIYDAIGKQVAVLVNDYLATGSYRYSWNASNLASGIYFYRIEAKNFNMVKKMVLLK
ncbi:MAG TPA: T9SS type A sorting domain-containing protein, partial [Ignavibacteriaceae bacterium]|nr:T9SS type A sorting domain-containing protein [Ignavibacteriaceae bacterium]